MRDLIINYSKKLVDCHLNRGTSGNCSVRVGDRFLITPSGVPSDLLVESDILEMDFHGNILSNGIPSSEWHFHRDILFSRTDVTAVIHTHSNFATALSCLRKDIPSFHYMIAIAGGKSIRCVSGCAS